MSYEYSEQGSKLDFPNPFYCENWFLGCASLIAMAGAAILLIQSRTSLAAHQGFKSWLPLLLGIGLLLMGLAIGKVALTHLRFFFGRNEPIGLAPQLDQDKTGRSNGSDWLKRILRQNALEYIEPRGPLNGLLYSLLRNLIFAPPAVQGTAQAQFQTAIAIVVTLVSFVVAWAGFSDPRAAAWMGLFYFGFSIFLLLWPLRTSDGAHVGLLPLVLLILAAVFAPVVVPRVAGSLPDITWLSLDGQTLFVLLASLLAVGLYFMALVAQMNAPPHTDMARETETLSMNAHPKQLLDEVDRNLQDAWTARIPNRRYARILPQVEGEQGPFSAELIEETQPMPADRGRIGIGAALGMPRFRWIALLDVLGVLMVLLGVVWLALFAMKFDPQHLDTHSFSMLTLGLAMLALCGYCLGVGHRLWARIDFTSRLVWVEMEGNFQSAQVNLGNDLTSQMRTSRRVINIETMTLRVWAAELDSVIFDKQGARAIIAMRGVPDYARGMVDHLTEFARNQSVIVAPTSAADLQKGKLLGAMNQVAGQPVVPAPLLQAAAPAAAPAAPARSANSSRAAFCTECGNMLSPTDRFCGSCGTPVGG